MKVNQIFISARSSSKPLKSSLGYLNLKENNYIYRILNVAVIISFIGFITLTPTLLSATTPNHANSHARNNLSANDSIFGEKHKKHNNIEEWAKGRIMVMPRAGLPAKAFAKILQKHDAKAKKIGQSDLYIVHLPEYTEEGVITRLSNHPHLKFAELDYAVYSSFTPNDPYFANAWHLPKTGATIAWNDSQGEGITIAILDTGVDSSHPDLAARMVPGWNFYDNNSDTSDVHGHGTAVAGAAAASSNNSTGVASMAGNAMIMPVRIASPDAMAYGSTIAQGLTWAADNGARVANISYSGVPGSSAVINASQYMKNKNGLVIVAAGNAGIDEGYTANTAMIPVSATNNSDAITSWSSYGNYVAMSAPGIDIWTTFRNSSYGLAWGTSLASPVTAGTVALLMAANPVMNNTDIENALFSTAVDLGATGRDPYYGYGRVDAAAAMQAVITDAPEVDSIAPSATILTPFGGATVSDLVPVDIEVYDNVRVERTELWVNNTSVAIDTSEPFAFTWDSKGTANGVASMVVRAIDDAGNAAFSDAVEVNVDNPDIIVIRDTEPPVVQIINPVAGDVSGKVTITVNASDNSNTSDIVLSIYINDALIATGTGSTLSTSWSTRPKHIKAGEYIIKAVAKDAADNVASTSVSVNLNKAKGRK